MSNFNLTPLVQASGPDPFADCVPGWPFTNGEPEPQLAVDPTNPNHFVGVWIQSGLGIAGGVSFNGGNTWQEVVIPGITACSGGIYSFAADPWVTFAANGDVYVSALADNGVADNGTKLGSAVFVTKSTDGGLTWDAPTAFPTVGNNDGYDKPAIAADPFNAQFAYVTWTDDVNNRGTTMFSRTTDGGQTWEPVREILDPGGRNFNIGQQIVVLPNGTLVNLFAQNLYKNDSGGIRHEDTVISLIRSPDRGQTWLPGSAPIHVADILSLTDTNTIPGELGVANPDGGVGIQAVSYIPDFAVNPANGNLYAVWQDVRFSSGQYYSVAFSMSTDGGFTWSAPIRINQTPENIPAADRQAFIPSVAVAADGTVAVTYYDFRNNTSAPGLLTDYWMVHAHPNTDLTNPASWTSENRLTESSFDLEKAGIHSGVPAGYFVGDYEGLSAAGNQFAAFWSMPHTNPDGTNDIGSIFFREALPAESHAELQAVDDHFRSETTAIPGDAMLDKRLASMLKSVESASTRNALSVDRLFARSDQAREMPVFGKSKPASRTLANGTEADVIRGTVDAVDQLFTDL
jgi:hypothetical protein